MLYSFKFYKYDIGMGTGIGIGIGKVIGIDRYRYYLDKYTYR